MTKLIVMTTPTRTGTASRLRFFNDMGIHVVDCEGGQTRGESELKQLFEKLTKDGDEALKQLAQAFESEGYHTDLLKNLKEINSLKFELESDEPYYRRFQKRKF